MSDDTRLETMQEELKLLKGELKQSLASVRDYLLNMELPSSEFSTILEELSSGEGQNVTMSGTLTAPAETKPPEDTEREVIEAAPEDTPPEDENLLDVEEPLADEPHSLEEESLVGQEKGVGQEEPMFTEEESGEDIQPDEEVLADEDIQAGIPDEQEDVPEPDLELPLEEKQPGGHEPVPAEASLATPKVNMLANLITWVAKAKKEIGLDQLATFLEVYGISGHLSYELKEVIISLAQITDEKPEVASNPEIWSQAMLSLHGILTGGDAPLHPLVPVLTDNNGEEPLDDEELTEEKEPEDMPLKLKLVFPNGDGKTKEFCINLTPEEEEQEADSPPKKKQKLLKKKGE